MKNDFVFRDATVDDIDFLVETIIESEKSGTDLLSYSTVFDLSEDEAKKYISDMLREEIDGCELSISSFMIAETDGRLAGAISTWIEGLKGVPSIILKGNLLNFFLPKRCIEKALQINHIIQEIHIEYLTGSIQLGLIYVTKVFRGLNLAKMLIDERIKQLKKTNPDIGEMYVQVFGNNQSAIKLYKKAKFKTILTKESSTPEILCYLPSNRKILMKKELI